MNQSTESWLGYKEGTGHPYHAPIIGKVNKSIPYRLQESYIEDSGLYYRFTSDHIKPLWTTTDLTICTVNSTTSMI